MYSKKVLEMLFMDYSSKSKNSPKVLCIFKNSLEVLTLRNIFQVID